MATFEKQRPSEHSLFPTRIRSSLGGGGRGSMRRAALRKAAKPAWPPAAHPARLAASQRQEVKPLVLHWSGLCAAPAVCRRGRIEGSPGTPGRDLAPSLANWQIMPQMIREWARNRNKICIISISIGNLGENIFLVFKKPACIDTGHRCAQWTAWRPNAQHQRPFRASGCTLEVLSFLRTSHNPV